MNDVDKLRKVVKNLVTEQINTDRRLVKELDEIDSSLKKLDKKYRALVNNSFSRVVLDDGQDGKLFDVQLYPVSLSQEQGDGVYRYDMRAYFHNSDRVYRNGLYIDDVKEFIDNELSKYIEDNSSYQGKALMKGKRPYIEDEEYDYAEEGTMKTPETDQMEEVKDSKKQNEWTPEDLAERKLEELEVGIGMDELAEKIENSIWGAIKREGESTHKTTAKSDHDVNDSDTAKNKHVLTKSKLRKAKTKKVAEKSKPLEHQSNITVTPTKVNTPKVKDFKDDKRKAVNESVVGEITDLSKGMSLKKAKLFLKAAMQKMNDIGKQTFSDKELFYAHDGVDYQSQDGILTDISFPEIYFSIDFGITPTEENIQKIKTAFDRFVGQTSKTTVEHAFDTADSSDWIGVNSVIPMREVSVENLQQYFKVLVQWSKTIVALSRKIKDSEKKELSEGVFDRLKAKAKGVAAGGKGAITHKLNKWHAAGGRLKAKAHGDKEALDQYKKKEKSLKDKERYRSRGKTGKRSIFKTEKEKAAAKSLFGTYSKRLDNRLNSFKTDLAKVMGIDEKEIIPTFEKLGLNKQSTILQSLFRDVQSFNKLSRVVSK